MLARVGRQTLTLWVETPGLALSRSLGVVLSYADGRECTVALPAEDLRLVSITLPRGAAPAGLEAGLCDAGHTGCLAVQLDIPQRR